MKIAEFNSAGAGHGVGPCPNPVYWGRASHCGCGLKCSVCGALLHTGVHMHLLGQRPGDPPFGHEFQPSPPPE